MISRKRMNSYTFKPMVDRIHNICNRWSNLSLSPAVKAILINTSLLSTLTYILSVYPFPLSTLFEISGIVRKFFWSRGSNGKGIHNVFWSVLMENKSERGLDIRNLNLVRRSYMAKHILKKHELWGLNLGGDLTLEV